MPARLRHDGSGGHDLGAGEHRRRRHPFGVVVDLEDPLGNLVTSDTASVTAAIGNNPGGATLTGVLAAAPFNGVATVNDLVLNKPGAGYTLQLNSGGSPTVTTAPFTVIGSAATKLIVTTQPPSTVTAGAGFGLVVTAEDANGDLDPTYTGNVTVGSRTAAAGACSAAPSPWLRSRGWRRSPA